MLQQKSVKDRYTSIITHLTLLGHTDGLTTTTGGLGVLTTHTETPVGPQTAMVPHLLQALKILTVLGVEGAGNDLGVTTVLDILLPIQEPVWNLELTRVGDDNHERLKLCGRELTSPLLDVNFGLLAGQDSETATHTPDGGHGVWDLLATINVGVDDTQNVLEVVGCDERHDARQ